VHGPEGLAAPGAGASGDGPAVRRSDVPGLRVDAVVLAGGRASRLGGADKPALVVGERSLLASVIAAAAAAGARVVVVVGPSRPGLVLTAGRLRVVREEPPGSGPVPALRRGLAEVAAPWVLVLAADLPFIRAGHLSSLLAAAAGAGPAAGAVLADDTSRPQWEHRPAAGAVLADDTSRPQWEHRPAAGAVLADDTSRPQWEHRPAAGAVLADDTSRPQWEHRPAAGAVLADDAGRLQWLAGCWPTAALRAACSGYRGGSLRGLLGPLSPVILGPSPGQPGPPPWLDCDTEDDVRRARAWSGDPAGPGPGVPQ
jgi:molybdopterin-guanine dinucleotide biosynthesis protein A